MNTATSHKKSIPCLALSYLQGFLVIAVVMLHPHWTARADAQTSPKLNIPQLNPQTSPPTLFPGTHSKIRTNEQQRFSFRNEPGLMLEDQPNTSDENLLAESQRQAERRGAWIVPTLYALGGVLTLSGLYVMLREEAEDAPPVRVRIFPGFSGGGAQANIRLRF